MNADKMREEFESWAAVEMIGASLSTEREMEVAELILAASWRAWQAARGSVVVALPQEIANASSSYWHNVRNNTIAACRRIIEEQGVTVK